MVTVVDSAWGLGGAERLAAELATRLDPDAYDKVFCVTRPAWGAGVEDELRGAGVRTLTLDRGSRAGLHAWQPLLSLLRRERSDVVHCHDLGSSIWGTTLGRLARVPVVIAHRHRGSHTSSFERLLNRHVVARQADVFLTVSKQARQEMIERERIDPSRIRILPNGIPPLPEPGPGDVRAELGIGSRDPVVGTVCVLRREKALDVLVRSVARVAPEWPDVKLVIVGLGPDEARLRALVEELGVEQLVRFAGPRTNVEDFVAVFDVAALSSDWEGMPLSVMEYMAAGKPVVATRVGGVPDLIDNGVHGLLVAPRDVDGIARAISSLLHDGALRARMGAAGRDRQQRDFTIEATVRHLELLLDELSTSLGAVPQTPGGDGAAGS